MSIFDSEKNKPGYLEKPYEGTRLDYSKNQETLFNKGNSQSRRKWGIVIVVVIIIFIIGGLGYLYYKNNKRPQNSNWYAFKLSSGESLFGQTDNIKSDPIVLKNVYYRYDGDQNIPSGNNADSDLKLVKRTQEVYGPTGMMYLSRSQMIYAEPLRMDSKVLSAILNYQK